MSRSTTAAVLVIGAVTAVSVAAGVAEKPADEDEFARAVTTYYDAIAARQYGKAYGMLSQCHLRLTDADGSVAEWPPPPDLDSWSRLHHDLGSLALLEIRRHPPRARVAADTTRGDAGALLGIRTYCVALEVETPGVATEQRRRCLSVVKGVDGAVRILGTRPGP